MPKKINNFKFNVCIFGDSYAKLGDFAEQENLNINLDEKIIFNNILIYCG